jgi:hypothetical protein
MSSQAGSWVLIAMISRRSSVHRRQFLLATFGTALIVACQQPPPPRQEPSAAAATPELDNWTAEARGMLADALMTLRTFDAFAAYRISITPSSSLRSPSELMWDPPTGQAWDDATHVARGLRSRGDQLFQAVTTVQIDSSAWRTQRDLAAIVHDIGDLGDALASYRNRIDGLPPGEASGALTLLDGAWNQWDSVAGRLGIGRSELIGCGA